MIYPVDITVKYPTELSKDGIEEVFVSTAVVILFIMVFAALACCSEYVNASAASNEIVLQGDY